MLTEVLIDRVLAKMEGKIAGPEVEQILPTALSLLGKRTAESKQSSIPQLLKKEFTVTVAAGVGSVTTALTADEPLLPEYLPQALAYTSDGVLLHFLPDRVQLGLERSKLVMWYTVDSSTFRTKDRSGSENSLNTTVTITANFTPLIGSVPDLLSDSLVDIVVTLLSDAPPAV